MEKTYDDDYGMDDIDAGEYMDEVRRTRKSSATMTAKKLRRMEREKKAAEWRAAVDAS